MAPHVITLSRRAEETGLSKTMVTLLVVLMVLLIIAVSLVAVLLILRQRRKARRAAIELSIPKLSSSRLSTSSRHSNHRRTSAQPSQSIHVFREKQLFEASCDPIPRSSSLPEIRITFPEEVDATGKRQSGRVVVVHIGDTSLGLEPVSENLPSYQQSEGGRFESIDLERVGGLMEKETRSFGWN